ncbi:hypothetical protein TNCV_120981 [Trichonephila clavipes]|nr:hypothetical protein TNCV_120981 [Trichonephila clavipes]
MRHGFLPMTQKVRYSRCSGSQQDPLGPKKSRMSESKFKVMLIVFFDINRMAMIEWFPSGKTVNRPYYIEVPKRLREKSLQLWRLMAGCCTRTMNLFTLPYLSSNF